MGHFYILWAICILFAYIKDYNIYNNFVHRNHMKVWCNDKNPIHRFENTEKGYRQRILSLPGAREILHNKPIDNWVDPPDIQVDWIDGFHPSCIGESLRFIIFEESMIYNLFDLAKRLDLWIILWSFITPIKVLILLFRGF
jgi:hypothetical protein